MSLKFFFSFSKESTNYTNFTNGGRESSAYNSRLTAGGKIRVISEIRGGFLLSFLPAGTDFQPKEKSGNAGDNSRKCE